MSFACSLKQLQLHMEVTIQPAQRTHVHTPIEFESIFIIKSPTLWLKENESGKEKKSDELDTCGTTDDTGLHSLNKDTGLHVVNSCNLHYVYRRT